MTIRIPLTAPVVLLALLAGCATTPIGPTSRVMPAPGKPFDVFRYDDAECRQFAAQSAGTSTNEASANNMAGSMALGTVVGATAGALMGGQRGDVLQAAGHCLQPRRRHRQPVEQRRAQPLAAAGLHVAGVG